MSDISRTIPPQPLINLANPVVRALLRSPVHAVLDSALLVLHIVGRRTRRSYDLPVGYVDLDGELLVVTQHAWRANVRGGAVSVPRQAKLQMSLSSRLPPESTAWPR